MNPEWGARRTDYVTKMEGVCEKCNLPCPYKDGSHFYFGSICVAAWDIKYDYTHGRPRDAIALLRCLPSELLKDYLSDERRTPTELKTVILDELQKRNETENIIRL